jgi:hypothetical protein
MARTFQKNDRVSNAEAIVSHIIRLVADVREVWEKDGIMNIFYHCKRNMPMAYLLRDIYDEDKI